MRRKDASLSPARNTYRNLTSPKSSSSGGGMGTRNSRTRTPSACCRACRKRLTRRRFSSFSAFLVALLHGERKRAQSLPCFKRGPGKALHDSRKTMRPMGSTFASSLARASNFPGFSWPIKAPNAKISCANCIIFRSVLPTGIDQRTNLAPPPRRTGLLQSSTLFLARKD